MSGKIKARKILLQYLKLKIQDGDPTIRNSEMTKVANFGQRLGKYHSAGTYERAFRRLKNKPEELETVGIYGFKDISHRTMSAEKVLRFQLEPNLFKEK